MHPFATSKCTCGSLLPLPKTAVKQSLFFGAWLQIEEAYIGADQFCSLVRQDSQSVLRNELNVLHGLKFDLITHPPLRALDGFFQVRPLCPLNTAPTLRFQLGANLH